MDSSTSGPQPKEVDFDATMKSFDEHPFFMSNMPADMDANDHLEALQSLIFDDTPDNTARGFKEQGNDYFKGKKYRDALGFYSQAIAAKPDDKALLESLYLNRAACNLELQNYGSTLRDCAAAIKLNSQASKAYYRSARALMMLGRYEEAIDSCQRCLAFDADNQPVAQLQKDVEARIEKREAAKREKERREKEEQDEKDLLELACKARHLTFTTTESPDRPGYPKFDPRESKPYTPTSQILFPVFFLYPQHSTSDFISSFAEHSTFSDQLAAVFPADGEPADWDQESHAYKAGKLSVYAVTKLGRLLKVGPKMTLADVCLKAGVEVEKEVKGKKEKVMDGLEIRDGCMSFVVVPKGDVETWYVEDFKKKKAAGAKLS